jgi:2-(3-amino-3-carboxypropyl)histidine synthase
MKTLFLHTRYVGKIALSKIEISKLPKNIGVVTTTQFIGRLHEIKSFLEKNDIQVFVDDGKQRNPGQLLGCDVGAATKLIGKVDAFLYIGSGEFHPLGVSFQTKMDVFTFNPVSGVFSKLNPIDVEKYKNSKKASLSKFLASDRIGFLVSTKPGQYSYMQALKLKDKLKDKECFIFVFDTLDADEMQNFPFIDFWVNTACPRIADDKDKRNIIDMAEIEKFFDLKQ